MVAEQWESLASHPVVCLISTNRMKGVLQVSEVKALLGIHSSPCVGREPFKPPAFREWGREGNLLEDIRKMSQRNPEGGGILLEWLDLLKSQSSIDTQLVLGLSQLFLKRWVIRAI